MALPVTITGISTAVAPVGPFKATSGNYYFFGRDGTTATTLQAFKSTAPDTSWASVTTKTGFTTAILGLAAYQVGNIIHIAVMDGTSSSSVGHKYVSFDAGTDTFGTTETIVAAANVTGQLSSGWGTSIVVRSGGEAVAFYNGLQTNSSGQRARLYYARRTGVNTWAAGVRVDSNTAVDSYYPLLARGASDRLHFLFFTASGVYQRHLTSANALGTAALVGTSNFPHDVVTYDDGGTIRHVGINSGSASRWSSADNPTVTTVTVTAGSPGRGVDDSGNVYWLYQNNADSDLYIKSSTDDGATWSGATSAYVGTVAGQETSVSKNQYAYQRGGNVVFPYIFNEGGTLKYNEYTVRLVGYTLPADVGAVALAGVATGLRRARTPLTAVTGAVALAGTTTGLRAARVLIALPSSQTSGHIDEDGVSSFIDEDGITSWIDEDGVTLGGGGPVAVSGQAVTLLLDAAATMPAATGAVVLAGQAATLRYSVAATMPAATGAITLAGQAASLRYGHVLKAVTGPVAVAGQAATLRHATVMPATQGAVVLNGVATQLLHSRKITMAAAPGAVVFTGLPVGLVPSTADAVLIAAAGAITVAGQVAALRAARVLVALPSSQSSGHVDEDGVSSFIDEDGITSWVDEDGVTLGGYGGSVAVTGQAATLRRDAVDVTMPAVTGAITASMLAANLRAAYVLKALPSSQTGDFIDDNGVTSFIDDLGVTLWVDDNDLLLGGLDGPVAVTGQDAELRRDAVDAVMPAVTGTITLAGQAVTLRYGHVTLAAKGAVVVNGTNTTLRRIHRMIAAPGGIVVTCIPAGLSTAAHKQMAAVKGDILLSGTAAAFRAARKLPAATGPIIVTGLAANLDADFLTHYALSASLAQITVSGAAAELQRTDNRQVDVGPLHFGRRAYIPRLW